MNGYLTVLPVAGRENAGVGRSVLGFYTCSALLKGFCTCSKLTKPACFLKGTGSVAWIQRNGYGTFAWVSSQNANLCIGSESKHGTGATGLGKGEDSYDCMMGAAFACLSPTREMRIYGLFPRRLGSWFSPFF